LSVANKVHGQLPVVVPDLQGLARTCRDKPPRRNTLIVSSRQLGADRESPVALANL
jgi:hypothetical protein